MPLPEGTFCLMLPMSESASSKFPKDFHSLVYSGKKSPDPTKSQGKKLVAGRCLQNGRNQFPRGRGGGSSSLSFESTLETTFEVSAAFKIALIPQSAYFARGRSNVSKIPTFPSQYQHQPKEPESHKKKKKKRRKYQIVVLLLFSEKMLFFIQPFEMIGFHFSWVGGCCVHFIERSRFVTS